MNMQAVKEKLMIACAASAVALALGVTVTGCDGGGGGAGASAPAGAAGTLTGNVASFKAGGVSFYPAGRPGMLARWSDAAANIFVATAEAGMAGVQVTVLGTGITATTDADGNFVLTGVPAGNIELVFTMGAHSAILALNVAADTTIQLDDVNISETSVSVGSVKVRDVVPGSGSSVGGNVESSHGGNSGSGVNSGHHDGDDDGISEDESHETKDEADLEDHHSGGSGSDND